MKLWIERALAGLRWGWDHITHVSIMVWSKVVALGNTIYDPPPIAYKRLFFTGLAIFVAGGLTFAFVNSWFYKPTAQYFTSLLEDGDVFIPDMHDPKPLPPVAEVVTELPAVEVVCHDMSDTPQCEPVKDLTPEVKKEVSEIPPPVAKPPVGYKAKKSPTGYKRRKHQPYVTYWGY